MDKNTVNSNQNFKNLSKNELFFAFVAPIGSNIEVNIEYLKSILKTYNYKVEHIKLTDCFKTLQEKLPNPPPLITKPLYERYDSFIKFGNYLRKEFKNNSILACLGVQQILSKRASEITAESFSHKEVTGRTAYIIDQIKRKEEVDFLKSIYGSSFFQISIYSSRAIRVDNLSRKIATSNNSTDQNKFRSRAEALVTKDENEASEDTGQRISDVFHEADFIIDANTSNSTSEVQLKRFVDIILGSNSSSPTKDEYGLYTAKGASLRSVDLSRQVGAAIFSNRGEIISLGANEVPKAGGGTYWCDDPYDDRDFKRKQDLNDKRKKELLSEIIKIIDPEADIENLLLDKRVKDSQFMDALEYGRIIHAEMSAICDSARIGRSIDGAVLYCTTFPCHMCAKHIVASGISEVVFLEPYPKSLAGDLHSDSIEIEGQSRGTFQQFPAVKFRHFCGVSPKRYRDLFEKKKRKENGRFMPWQDGQPNPMQCGDNVAYFRREFENSEYSLKPLLESIGLDLNSLNRHIDSD